MIVGGALESDNQPVYQKFIELAGGPKNAVIGIIPTASGSPSSSMESFRANLIKYGMDSSRIIFIPLAMLDCESTPNIDESLWIKNANSSEVASLIRKTTALWFTGGDQSRTIKILRNADGSNTLALDAIYEVYKKGSVIGGTSAGAAIMSDVMITGGVSMASLKFGISNNYIDDELKDNGALTLGKGLNFFKYGIVDQHFDKKNRLGRLVAATLLNDANYRMGFGVDENTALVYYSKTQTIEALGAGGLTIVNSKNAELKKNNSTLTFVNVLISHISSGDQYNLITEEITYSTLRKPTIGNESYDIKSSVQTGIFSPNSSNFKDFVSYYLIDNKSNSQITTYCFDDENMGLKIRFSKTAKTKGYWTDKINGRDDYSFENIRLDITPMRLNFEEVK